MRCIKNNAYLLLADIDLFTMLMSAVFAALAGVFAINQLSVLDRELQIEVNRSRSINIVKSAYRMSTINHEPIEISSTLFPPNMCYYCKGRLIKWPEKFNSLLKTNERRIDFHYYAFEE